MNSFLSSSLTIVYDNSLFSNFTVNFQPKQTQPEPFKWFYLSFILSPNVQLFPQTLFPSVLVLFSCLINIACIFHITLQVVINYPELPKCLFPQQFATNPILSYQSGLFNSSISRIGIGPKHGVEPLEKCMKADESAQFRRRKTHINFIFFM